MIEIPKIQLSNKLLMPSIGFGTNSTETEKLGDVERAVKIAIDTGYRYFDTSRLYGNEAEIGQAIKTKIDEGIIRRQDVFIVNKIGCTVETAEDVEKLCRLSLKCLTLDFVDLYLLHIPYKYRFKGEHQLFPLYSEPQIHVSVDYRKTWRSMEKLVEKGLTKSIGIANCNLDHLSRILASCTIKPVVCHIECCPGFHQRELIQFCNEHKIQVTAYCPFTRPDFQKFAFTYVNDESIKQMCFKYNKTPSQLILRYLYQLGAIPVPKSITKLRIQQYFHIFDFELSEMEVKTIDTFYKEERNVALEKELFPMFPLRRNIKWKYDD